MRFFPAKKHIIYEPRTWRTKKLSNPFLNVKKNREMHLEQTGHPEYICGFSVGLNTYAAPTVFILARSSVQSLSCVRIFETPRIAACQASLFITKSRSSLKLTSIESMIPSSHFILRRPLLLLPPIPPSIRVFSNESTLRMRWPNYWSFSLASFLPKKSQGWSPSEWFGWISLQSKGLSRVSSNNTVQKHEFFGSQLSSQSNSHIHTWTQEKP